MRSVVPVIMRVISRVRGIRRVVSDVFLMKLVKGSNGWRSVGVVSSRLKLCCCLSGVSSLCFR